MSIKRVLGAFALALALSAQAHAAGDDVNVYAAASLTDALNDIGAQFTAKTGHLVQPTYDGSSALAKQIEQGAPAQVFASADLTWMDYLVDKNRIDPASRIDLLGNTLVLVAPADSKPAPLEITPKTDIAALAGAGRIAVGDPDAVPVGLYFRQAMERSGQWAAVEPKLARAASVRAALALVERGEVALGVVYSTDAAIPDAAIPAAAIPAAAIPAKVVVVGKFPVSMHDRIVYPFALVAGKETPAARAFLDYLRGAAAKAVFVRYGFIPL